MNKDSFDQFLSRADGIRWCCVSKNDTILVEVGDQNESYNKPVIKAAKNLLKKKATPGWEFTKERFTDLRGVAFYVYDEDELTKAMFIWKFCAIYNKTMLHRDEVKFLLEKIVTVTKMHREHEFQWRYGGLLAVQDEFGPVLLHIIKDTTAVYKAYNRRQGQQQIFHTVTPKLLFSSFENPGSGSSSLVDPSRKRIQEMQEQVSQLTNEVMAKNIEMILEREENIHKLKKESDELLEMSQCFKKRAKQVKRWQKWQHAKHGVLVGSIVTGVVAAVTIPPLIALM